MRVRTFSNLVLGAAGFLADRLREGTAGGREFSFAVSGGRTPWAIFGELAQAPGIPWERVHIYQVDERLAPPGDADRNLTHLTGAIMSKVPAVLHPLPVDDADIEVAAARYGSELPGRLDLVHLGLGADGHTASLVPGDPVLEFTDRDVALTEPYQGHRRLTLTLPVLDRARQIVWIVTGADKIHPLAQLLAGDQAIPAARVARDRAVVLTDLSIDGGNPISGN